MRHSIVFRTLILSLTISLSLIGSVAHAQGKNEVPTAQKDTCKVGVYMTSLYDLSFSDNSFSTVYWLWFTYTNDGLDPLKSFEVLNTKQVATLADTKLIRTEGAINYATAKMRITAKKEWDLKNYPFDYQHTLVVNIEATDDTSRLVFIADTANSGFSRNIILNDWAIESMQVQTSKAEYATNFGDPTSPNGFAYSNCAFTLTIHRKGSWAIFYKLFAGAYIPFLISMLVFWINPKSVDPRFGLSVGALFAVVANKYVIESSVKVNNSLTLADNIHAVTFLCLFLTVFVSTISLLWMQQGKEQRSRQLDRMSFWTISSIYVLVNVILLFQAHH
ncbi:MAG: hypothetical protein ACOVSW_12675 [Candidatus Kapaibacteriota bacterium]